VNYDEVFADLSFIPVNLLTCSSDSSFICSSFIITHNVVSVIQSGCFYTFLCSLSRFERGLLTASNDQQYDDPHLGAYLWYNPLWVCVFFPDSKSEQWTSIA
jgi:hypothetical protein